MMERSREFDLGLDQSRIRDPRDAHRQHATADELLRRFFDPDPAQRWEVQLLADEVGMGKTFVALATAYSILAHLRDGKDEGDLAGCYQKVLVVTPPNSALQRKWRREVSEFVQRCVPKEHRKDRAGWFAPAFVERLDELVIELRRRGSSPRVVVANMGVFGAKLRHYDLKRRYLLGMLFRFWGARFRGEQRERLLRGAPPDWPRDPNSIALFEEKEIERLPFFENEVLSALDRLSRRTSRLEELLELCREIAQPYVHGRDEQFVRVDRLLDKIYRRMAVQLIRQDLPLLIVDEAHNWKNGPTTGANGFRKFAAHRAFG
mgnify:CR=1 FL=1